MKGRPGDTGGTGQGTQKQTEKREKRDQGDSQGTPWGHTTGLEAALKIWKKRVRDTATPMRYTDAFKAGWQQGVAEERAGQKQCTCETCGRQVKPCS